MYGNPPMQSPRRARHHPDISTVESALSGTERSSSRDVRNPTEIGVQSAAAATARREYVKVLAEDKPRWRAAPRRHAGGARHVVKNGVEWRRGAHLSHVLEHAARAAVLAAEEDANERLCLVQARFDCVDVALWGAAFT